MNKLAARIGFWAAVIETACSIIIFIAGLAALIILIRHKNIEQSIKYIRHYFIIAYKYC